MKTIKCYNCGGDVIVGKDSRIGVCSCCFTEVPIPEEGTSVMEMYSRANALLSQSHFDEAREIFQSILAENTFEAAACWGMALSEYGIEYVTDASGELLPTLHRLSLTSFQDYLYTKKAIEYAPDLTTKEFFQRQSALIDQIQSKSLLISQKEDPYDIFICYKKTEEGEKRTADSRMAADYYRELTRRGYKVFFAEETLHVGEEYEPRIFAALHSARVLIAIASRKEYYEAVWVRNEWSRYADLIAQETGSGAASQDGNGAAPQGGGSAVSVASQGDNGAAAFPFGGSAAAPQSGNGTASPDGSGRLLIPLFSHMSHEELPEGLRIMPEYVEMDRLENPKQILLGLIAGHFGQAKADDVSDLRREVRKKESSVILMQESAENYLTRGSIALVNRDFSQAEEMFSKAMELEESADACLGLMMSDLQIPGREALHQYDRDISQNEWFQEALGLCADPGKREELEQIRETCLKNKQWSELCEVRRKEALEKSETFAAKAEALSLDLPSYQGYRELKRWADDSRMLRWEGVKTQKNIRKADVFFLVGNVLASLCFLLRQAPFIQTAEKPLSLLPTWLGVIALLVGYVIGVPALLAVWKPLWQWIGTYLAFMFAFQVMNLAEKKEYVFLGTIGIYLLYYLFFGLGARKKVRQMKRMLTELPKRTDSLEKLRADMPGEAEAAYEREMEDYRQYYQKASEWKNLTGEAKTRIYSALEGPLAALQEELAQIREKPV